MDLTNLIFTQGLPFNQSYKIKASEHVSGTISGLPDGIRGFIRNNIIRIRGVATTAGSGKAIINIDGIAYTRPWTVIAERQTRGIPERSEPRQSGFTMADALLYSKEDFDVTGTYTGNPTNIYVEGLLRNWTYTWGSGTIHVIGDAADVIRLETGIWKIIIDGIEHSVNWRVNERAPVITNPGTQVFVINRPISIDILISNKPSVSIEGLQSKIYYERVEDGAELLGTPDRIVDGSENRRITINASTSGGDDTEIFDFTVVDPYSYRRFDLHSDNDTPLGIGLVGDYVVILNYSNNLIYRYNKTNGNFHDTQVVSTYGSSNHYIRSDSCFGGQGGFYLIDTYQINQGSEIWRGWGTTIQYASDSTWGFNFLNHGVHPLPAKQYDFVGFTIWNTTVRVWMRRRISDGAYELRHPHNANRGIDAPYGDGIFRKGGATFVRGDIDTFFAYGDTSFRNSSLDFDVPNLPDFNRIVYSDPNLYMLNTSDPYFYIQELENP